jgi:hypothetical protein
MDIYFERLKRRSEILGNHHKKYVRIVEKNIGPLMDRLENAGQIDRIHLWASAINPQKEFDIISQLGNTVSERLDDLGCYFALQYLQMNLSALDALRLKVTQNEYKSDLYANFMVRIGHDFRRLTGVYMDHLLRMFLPQDNQIDFVILGVGTRADQDDIDVGIVDTGFEHREILNSAISKMNSQMFKKAINLHFHLSEHVGVSGTFSASIDEYDDMLNHEIHDFVIISEMLGAARICGSRKLFYEFLRKVTSRYYYKGPNSNDTKFHEGYLRGIVGESRSFMFKELSRDFIKPKTDGLRMIKGGLYAAKTIYNLRQVNAWAILHALIYRDKRRKSFFRELEQTLSFLEIFRYLYQLLNSEEEEIHLSNDYVYDNLSIVAETMGYKSIGALSAQDFLLTDYYSHVLNSKAAIKKLLPSVIGHLETISIFGKMLHHRKVTENGERRIGNLAIRFLDEIQFFRGTRFWDDIVKVLEAKNGLLLKRLVNDLCKTGKDKRQETLTRFIDWGWNSFITMFSIIILIHRHREELKDSRLFLELNDLFFQRVRGTEGEAQRLSIVFTHHPQLVYQYIILLNESQQRKFHKWLSSNVWDPEVLPARDCLRFLLTLQYNTSKYFQRTMNNVLKTFPDYLKFLNDPGHLRLIGNGTLAEIEIAKTSKEKLDKLLFYHDFQFFHIGIRTLLNYATPYLAVQFNEFSDTYVRYVFDTVKFEIDQQNPAAIQNIDTFGLLITGGHGQIQAFDDDYDLILLVNSENPAIKEYCNKIVKRFHREIVKCGILPHYHLADITGSYVCTFSQIKKILRSRDDHSFIYLAQLLNSRLLVGSSSMLEQIKKEILVPYIYKRPKYFVKAILKEIYTRRVEQRKFGSDGIDLKNDPGGLRDIELFLMLARALFYIRQSSNFRLLFSLQKIFPDHEDDFKKLLRRYQFLRKIRNLSRLTIAADDILYLNHLVNLTEHLEIKSKRQLSPEELLLKRVWEYMRSTEKLTNRLIRKLILPKMNFKKGGGKSSAGSSQSL